MIARCLTFTALMIVAGLGVEAAQTPAPPTPAPAPTAQAGRGRTPTPRAPAAPAQPAAPRVDADAPPAPPPPPPPPSPNPVPRRENQSTNIRIDVTVTDQRPNVTPLTKTVSVVTGDGLNGSVRSQTNYVPSGAGPGFAPFNVDAAPTILADGKVFTRLTVQYDVVPPPTSAAAEGARLPDVRLLGTSIRDSVTLVLESGKPIVAIQSTDPVSDRKVSVEVKATILK